MCSSVSFLVCSCISLLVFCVHGIYSNVRSLNTKAGLSYLRSLKPALLCYLASRRGSFLYYLGTTVSRSSFFERDCFLNGNKKLGACPLNAREALSPSSRHEHDANSFRTAAIYTSPVQNSPSQCVPPTLTERHVPATPPASAADPRAAAAAPLAADKALT